MISKQNKTKILKKTQFSQDLLSTTSMPILSIGQKQNKEKTKKPTTKNKTMNKTPVPQLLALSACKYFINSSRYFIFSNSRVSSIYFLKNNPYFVAHKLTNGLRNFPQYSIFIRQLTLCLELSLGPVSACQLQVVFLIGSSIYSLSNHFLSYF